MKATATAVSIHPRERLRPNAFQERILEAFEAGAREVWAFGGNRSGKTTIGAWWAARGAVGDPAGGVTWVCCRDSKVQREITQSAILRFITPSEILVDRRRRRPALYETRGKIDFFATVEWRAVRDGVEPRRAGLVKFKNYCDGPRSVAGGAARRVWADEFTGERSGDLEFYRELRRSVVTTDGRLLFTLTAVRGLTPVLADVLERHRRGEPGLAVVYGDTAENEANLPAGAIESFARGLDEWESEVRLHGRVLPLAGRPYVPAAALKAIEVVPPARTEAINGLEVAIFEDPDAGGTYTVGIDAAEGVGRDRGAVVVLAVGWDRPSRVVATGAADVPPRALGEAAAALARRYAGRHRTALAAPEANGPGLVVIEALRDAKIRILPRPGVEDGAPAPERLGYLTGPRSRDVLLDGMRRDIVAGGLVIRSERLRDALATFVWGDRRPEAAPGFYDDEVFALALAHYAAGTIRAAPAPPALPPAIPTTVEDHFRSMKRRRFA